jgi:hypothetical protein
MKINAKVGEFKITGKQITCENYNFSLYWQFFKHGSIIELCVGTIYQKPWLAIVICFSTNTSISEIRRTSYSGREFDYCHNQENINKRCWFLGTHFCFGCVGC